MVVVVVVVTVVVDVVASVVVDGASVVGGEGHPVNSVVDLNKIICQSTIKNSISIYKLCLSGCPFVSIR